MKYYEIKYNDQRMIIHAASMEIALEQFKALKIEVKNFEISISDFAEPRK